MQKNGYYKLIIPVNTPKEKRKKTYKNRLIILKKFLKEHYPM